MTTVSTYPLEEAAEHFGNSPEWLAQQLRSGRFSGYKVGRKWRMSDVQIAQALETCRRDAHVPVAPARSTGLSSATATTRRRFAS
ncbi:excise [Mycobacterium phage prophiGD05-3]|nr:excise [Mycobacterium phage prophiGD05-3]